MTMPSLMNCEHDPDTRCPECAKKWSTAPEQAPDTKKLNAVVAILLLHHAERITPEQALKVEALCNRLVNTTLYQDDETDQYQTSVKHAIKLIEEYLEEEGV